MSWPANYGRITGQIPNTVGQVFFVAPSSSYSFNGLTYASSDGHDGLAPDRALATVNRAWALASANSGDVIVLLPGAHTVTESIAASTAGVTMTGLPGGVGNRLRPKTSLTISASDELINVTAADIEISNLTLIPITTDATVDLTAAGDRLCIHDCAFDMATPAASTSTVGVFALGAASNVLVERCYFECDGAQGNAIIATALLDSLISECTFSLSAGTWASAILCGAGTDRLLIEGCKFYCAGTAITVGVNGTGADQADGVKVVDCRFDTDVTVPIDGFSAGECNIAENYDMGVGSTDGGALIVAIT